MNFSRRNKKGWLSWSVLREALAASFVKLSPLHQLRNPVMFAVYAGTLLTTAAYLQSLCGRGAEPSWFTLAVAGWLWSTVLFANFAEALAEGRGKAQADYLRGAKHSALAKKLSEPDPASAFQMIEARGLTKGDLVLVQSGGIIPADGEVVQGAASVDESAITGESAPVIREAGGDRSAATGGTKVLSDWLIIRVTVEAGQGFLDRMIQLVEGAKRQRTPNEIALGILLAALSIVVLLVCATLLPFSLFAVKSAGQGTPVSLTVLAALFVCLAPTTIGALLSAIGIAGMNRLVQKNVLAMSGQAVEAAGDVDVLLLDKTGTITLGNRQAASFHPAAGTAEKALAEGAQLASLLDETPEGRSIVVLAKKRFGLRERQLSSATFHPFTAKTRMSGCDLGARKVRKGAAEAIRQYVERLGGVWPQEIQSLVDRLARAGATPLVVSENQNVLGVIELRDIVKGGIRERFSKLKRMGIHTVMITGDNHLTAAAIAAEAGVDDFLAEATPEAKLDLIRNYQAGGRLVAMTGDGTNDAPALAQADVAVVMNSGTQAAKEAGNLVDLDSDPTKLIEILETGKQLLVTRGALTTFSIANDIAKYFAIIPAAFAATYPALAGLNFMRLATPESAILSALAYNALIIVALIPLALKGVNYSPAGADALLRKNLLVYGLGGLAAPFVGIKLVDLTFGWLKLM